MDEKMQEVLCIMTADWPHLEAQTAVKYRNLSAFWCMNRKMYAKHTKTQDVSLDYSFINQGCKTRFDVL